MLVSLFRRDFYLVENQVFNRQLTHLLSRFENLPSYRGETHEELSRFEMGKALSTISPCVRTYVLGHSESMDIIISFCKLKKKS